MVLELKLSYSSVYDKNWAIALLGKFDQKIAKENFDTFIKNFKDVWKDKEEKIIELISTYSHLNWTSKKVKIYFVSNLKISGFSDPLTIKMIEDYPKVSETIIHELLHNIFVQNLSKINPILIELKKLFPEELKTTRTHLLINFLSNKIFEEIFGEKEAKRIKSIIRTYKGLKRSLDLLEDTRIYLSIEKLIEKLA